MLLRMAIATLRGERAVAATLVGLLLLSALLACAGTALMARLAGAGETLLDRADAPHLVQMHSGEVDVDEVEEFARGRPEVTAHRVQPLLGLEGAQLFLDGESQAASVQQNLLVVPDDRRDLLLDEQDRPITDVHPGTIWLPLFHQLESGVSTGDTVTITGPDGFRRELEVAGFLRDSTMNTAIAGSKRLAVSEEDLADIAAHTGTWEHLLSFWVHDPSADLTSLRTAYQESALPSAGPMVDRSAFRLFTVLAEGLVATIVLLGAVLVLVVGLLCLRLGLRTSLERDRREIAVMGAIGIPARDIRTVYLLVHGGLASLAALGGLCGGLLLEPVLSAGFTRYVGPTGGAEVVLAPAGVALLLVLGVVLTVHLQLRALRRLSPLEALRGTFPRERRRGAAALSSRASRIPTPSLHRLPLPVGPALGVLSLLRRGGSTGLLVAVFSVCAVLVMLPTSVATTLASEQFSSQLGIGDADLRADLPYTGEDSAERFQQMQQAFAEDPRLQEHTAMVTTRHSVRGEEGSTIGLPVTSGDHEALPVAYADGRAPRGETEIALSLLALAETGTAVGETLPIQIAGQWRELTVVGSYQDITYGGITAKGMLPTEGEQVLWYSLGGSLAPGAAADAREVAADLTAQLPGLRVFAAEDHQEQLLGPLSERVSATAAMTSGAALLLAALLTVMIMRLWIAAEATPIAVQRALGAALATLRAPYLTRMLVTLAAGLLLGTGATLSLGQGLFNLLLEGLFAGAEHLFQGTSRVELVVDPLRTGLAQPLLLAGTVLAAALFTCRRLRTLEVRTLLAD